MCHASTSHSMHTCAARQASLPSAAQDWPLTQGLHQHVCGIHAGQVEVQAGLEVLLEPGDGHVVAHAAMLDQRVDCERGGEEARRGMVVQDMPQRMSATRAPACAVVAAQCASLRLALPPSAAAAAAVAAAAAASSLEFCAITAYALLNRRRAMALSWPATGAERSASSSSKPCTPAYGSSGVRVGSSQGVASNSSSIPRSVSSSCRLACRKDKVREAAACTALGRGTQHGNSTSPPLDQPQGLSISPTHPDPPALRRTWSGWECPLACCRHAQMLHSRTDNVQSWGTYCALKGSRAGNGRSSGGTTS